MSGQREEHIVQGGSPHRDIIDPDACRIELANDFNQHLRAADAWRGDLPCALVDARLRTRNRADDLCCVADTVALVHDHLHPFTADPSLEFV
jgi:hypothetical protein